MDDPVLSVTELTEAEIQELRKTDAWLPSETTRQCLLENNKSVSNSTMPRIIAPPAPIDITDPLRRELTIRYRSESKADSIRPVITADMVSQDTDGLMDLIIEFIECDFSFHLPFLSQIVPIHLDQDNLWPRPWYDVLTTW
ncbi:unnamed protein product [Rodentolepis nana]|uniref:RWD domain-containing protein n=1 Tax=Rodentolepis nana TaxID=102285 RepID=A0A0R3TFR3_RODNA|nr:unnamed protein product [Rodentolepis nana]